MKMGRTSVGRVAKRPEADAAPLPATRRFVPISYRVPDAAEMIGVSSAFMWGLIAERRITARKIDGATVIMHDDLHAFVAGSPVVDRNVAQ